MRVGGPGARVLELGERRDQGEFTADAAVNVRERLESQPGASPVELRAPELESPGHGTL